MILPRTCLFAAAMALALAACDPGNAPAARDPGIDPGGPGDPALATMAFHGRRPCVDCAGIEAWLQLREDDRGRRYALTERYLGADGGERRFEERGQWRSEGDLLRLRADDGGGERVYARMPGHRLQAVASDGAPLPAAMDDVMVASTFGNGG